MSTLLLLAVQTSVGAPSSDLSETDSAWSLQVGEIGTDTAAHPALLNVSTEHEPSAVVGGSQASIGDWPSTVAVIFDGAYQGCTGTLVAPTVVITAAHCVQGQNATHVLAGTANLNSGGEFIAVSQASYHPSYSQYGGSDIAVLQLQSASSQPTSVIATDCVRDDNLHDGEMAAIVGFGATNAAGTQYSNWMQEGFTPIVDHDCSQDQVSGNWTTCDPGQRPGKELFAGGGGIDACFGDSGGPIYIQGDDDDWYVAGVTSRGGTDQFGNPCGSGGVWVRPDAFMGWLEGEIGFSLDRPSCGSAPPPADPTPPPDTTPPPAPAPDTNPPPDTTPPDTTPTQPTDPTEPAPPSTGFGLAPVVTAGTMVVPARVLGSLQLEIEDPDSTSHGFEIVESSIMGVASVDESGLALYSATKGARGIDRFTVRVTDDQGNQVDVAVEVQIVGGGCSSTGGYGVGGLFALVMLLIRRRRA